jgi:hypothetical protein
MTVYSGVEVENSLFLTSALNECQPQSRSASFDESLVCTSNRTTISLVCHPVAHYLYRPLSVVTQQMAGPPVSYVSACWPFADFNFWHQSFTFNSNKSRTWCNSFPVYYPDVCLQLNMFRAFFRLSSGAQGLQWQPLVLPSYRGDSRAVFVVGPAGRPDHEHSTAVTTIRR